MMGPGARYRRLQVIVNDKGIANYIPFFPTLSVWSLEPIEKMYGDVCGISENRNLLGTESYLSLYARNLYTSLRMYIFRYNIYIYIYKLYIYIYIVYVYVPTYLCVYVYIVCMWINIHTVIYTYTCACISQTCWKHTHTHKHAHALSFVMRFTESVDLLIEGILEGKLPTIWTDEKQRWEE